MADLTIKLRFLDFVIKNSDINEQFKLINNIYEKMTNKDDEELYIIYDVKFDKCLICGRTINFYYHH